jgi:hypothetical protein
MKRYLVFTATVALAAIFMPTYPAADESRAREYQTLYSLYEAGAHNPDLYIRLAELSTDPAYTIAFLRQARALAPTKVSMQEIQKYRDLIKNSQQSLRETPWWYSFVLQRYIPNYQIAYLVTFIFMFSTLYVMYLILSPPGTSVPRLLYFLLVMIGVLAFQYFFILPLAGDRFILAQSKSDFSMREGVVLESIPAHAGPSADTQETMILSPGAEILLYPATKTDAWVQIREAGKRKGWIRIDDTTVFTIRN